MTQPVESVDALVEECLSPGRVVSLREAITAALLEYGDRVRAEALRDAMSALRDLHPPDGRYDTKVGDCVDAIRALAEERKPQE